MSIASTEDLLSEVPHGYHPLKPLLQTKNAETMVAKVKALLQEYAKRKPAGVPVIAVFDIDNTLICENQAINPPIMEVMQLVRDMPEGYVALVTAREEGPEVTTWTVNQLRDIGLKPADYNALYLCPPKDYTSSSRVSHWKAKMRARVARRALAETQTAHTFERVWENAGEAKEGDPLDDDSNNFRIPVALAVGDQWWDVVPDEDVARKLRQRGLQEADTMSDMSQQPPLPYLRSSMDATDDEYILTQINDGTTLWGLKLPEFNTLPEDHGCFAPDVLKTDPIFPPRNIPPGLMRKHGN